MERMKDISDRTQTDLKNKIALMEKDKEKGAKEREKVKQGYE